MGTRRFFTVSTLVLTFVAFSISVVQSAPKRKAKNAYNSGVKKAKAGDIATAIDFFAKAVQIDSKYGVAWRDLGLGLRFKGRYVEAVAAYERAVSLKKRSGTAWHKLGESYLDLNLAERAVAPLRKAMKFVKKKKRGDVKLLFARALSAAGKYKEAISQYKELIKKSGSDKSLLTGLANAQARADQYANAVSTLKKVISMNPSEKKAHILMAQCYVEMNQTAQAKASYAAACDLGDRKSCMKAR